MIVIPAIDLMDGKVVRLEQGEAARATQYDVRPVRVVTDFARKGAKRIHIVDLDGAFGGSPQQRKLIGELSDAAQAHGATIQTGGGIRDVQTAEALLDAGSGLIVVGTLAVRDPEATEALCKAHPNRVIVAADARDGMVAVEGWQQASKVSASALAEAAQHWGAAAVLYTDVARDGMQGGPAVESTARMQQGLTIPVYASGGVGQIEHLDACVAAGIRGVIVGRALYEGAFTLEEALARC